MREFLTNTVHRGDLGGFIGVLGFTTLTRTAQAISVDGPSRRGANLLESAPP